MRLFVPLLMGSLLASGCADEEPCTTGGTYTLPTVTVRCETVQECGDGPPPTAHGEHAWVVIMPKTQDCGSFDFGTSTYYAKTEVASLNCSSGVCVGDSGTWKDDSDSTITKLKGANYRWCVWVDTDGDNEIASDQNEPRTLSDTDLDSCERDIVMTGFFDG